LLSITIAFDYTYDTNQFFNTPEKRDLIQQAADVVTGGLNNDDLTAISPTGSDTWSASFPNPATGAIQSVANLAVPADTIIIYVGGRPLPGTGEAGLGSTGGYSATGSQAWLDTVAARGHTGALAAPPTSYGPWGGSIAFDSVSTSWFFGTSTAGLTASETDFFTVAEHEIGHILGLGTSDSWFTHVAGNAFTGPAAMAVQGGPVPLAPDQAHWADGTTSSGGNAVMDPVLLDGTRLMFTPLDYAGLADVGWLVQQPSQSSTVQFSSAGYSVSETAGTATITVTRTGGLDPSTVDYSTSDGTALAGVDYLPTSGTLIFGADQTSATVTVPIINAGEPSGSELFNLTLSNPGSGVTLGAQSTATVTIVNEGPRPAGDFDGDGHTDLGVFRPATAQWLVQPSGNGPWSPVSFGAPNLVDIPVPADYDGVGHVELAVFRPSTAQWFIAGQSQPFTFGGTNLFDLPIPADYLGTGTAQLAVFRPSTGQWFIAGQAQPISFGAPNLVDIPVPADYDGVGHAELAVFRPSTGQWFIAGHSQPISFGATDLTDIPVPGDYDGVGHAELAVFRPSTGQWFIAGHSQPISFGATNLSDIPLEGVIGSLLKLGLIGEQPQPTPAPNGGTPNSGSTSNVPATPAQPPEAIHAQSLHSRRQSLHSRRQSLHSHRQSLHSHRQSLHSHRQSLHSHRQSLHSHRHRRGHHR
jgi:hypothetical protein